MTRILGTALLFFCSVAHADDAVQLRILSFNIWYGGEQASLDQVIDVTTRKVIRGDSC